MGREQDRIPEERTTLQIIQGKLQGCPHVVEMAIITGNKIGASSIDMRVSADSVVLDHDSDRLVIKTSAPDAVAKEVESTRQKIRGPKLRDRTGKT